MGHSTICAMEELGRTLRWQRHQELKQITDVVAYLERKGADIRKDCEERGVTCFTTPYPEHGKNFANAYEYEKQAAFDEYSDIFKENHGFRLRGARFGELSLDELEDLIDGEYRIASNTNLI